jgi:tetratricopeptide (TPR) repeat protein
MTRCIITFIFGLVAHNVAAQEEPDSVFLARAAHEELNTKNEFGYWATKGQEYAIRRDYQNSNRCFENAYLMRLNSHTLAYASIEESYEEVHEMVVLLYLKALNYLAMDRADDALVESRRLDEWIHPQHDFDVARKLVREDPLVYMLMGLLYDQDHSYDDARICWHNANMTYHRQYKNLLGKRTPTHVMRRAAMLSTSFIRQTNDPCACNGQLILIWNNGRAPEETLPDRDFKIKCSRGRWWSNDTTIHLYKSPIGDTLLSFYKFSRPVYNQSHLVVNGVAHACELLEDVTWNQTRLIRERLSYDGVHVWRRGQNWKTMPGNISFAVVNLERGENYVSFVVNGERGMKKETFTVTGDGKDHFHTITTLSSKPLSWNIPSATQLLSGSPLVPGMTELWHHEESDIVIKRPDLVPERTYDKKKK